MFNTLQVHIHTRFQIPHIPAQPFCLPSTHARIPDTLIHTPRPPTHLLVQFSACHNGNIHVWGNADTLSPSSWHQAPAFSGTYPSCPSAWGWDPSCFSGWQPSPQSSSSWNQDSRWLQGIYTPGLTAVTGPKCTHTSPQLLAPHPCSIHTCGTESKTTHIQLRKYFSFGQVCLSIVFLLLLSSFTCYHSIFPQKKSLTETIKCAHTFLFHIPVKYSIFVMKVIATRIKSFLYKDC